MATPERARMRFGIFLAPFHRVGENPTLVLERDLELMYLAGWRSRTMQRRPGVSAADERAREVHQRLMPGDRL